MSIFEEIIINKKNNLNYFINLCYNIENFNIKAKCGIFLPHLMEKDLVMEIQRLAAGTSLEQDYKNKY